TRVYDNDILSRCQSYNVTGNTMVFPAIDETSRVDGSRFGGAVSYWLDEAAQVTKSRPSVRTIRMVLKKLASLCYVTDELLADTYVALPQFLTNIFSQELTFRIGSALIRGTGTGM